MDAYAIVREVDGGDALIELEGRAGGCGRCDEPGGCRSPALTQALGESCRLFRLPNDIAAVPGQRVIVRLHDTQVLVAALQAYLIPPVLAIAGAATAAVFGPAGDGAALAGGLCGLALGAAIAILRARSARSRVQGPTLIALDHPAA